MEIQNILAHYKSLGKNEDRYVDSFNNIAAQYNDTQLRIISRFLPLNVKAVLEEKSQKYQQVMTFNNKVSNSLRYKNEAEQKQGPSEKLLKPKTKDMPMSKPVVIPNAVNMSGAKKLSKTKSINTNTHVSMQQQTMKQRPLQQNQGQQTPLQQNQVQQKQTQKMQEQKSQQIVASEPIVEQIISQEPVKRGRGRPKKTPDSSSQATANDISVPTKRGRGRPRKNPVMEEQQQMQEIELEETVLPGFEEPEDMVLPGVENQQEETTIMPSFTNQVQEDAILPGFETEQEDIGSILPGFEDTEQHVQNGYHVTSQAQDTYVAPVMPEPEEEPMQRNIMRTNNSYVQTLDISSLLTADKKIASFVGTSKNGTSFIVNNVAQILSSMGINTAILDTTANRNSYYIYTKNEEELRRIASYSIENLVKGMAKGIEVNKNLTVFTSLPDGKDTIDNVDEILQTLVSNYSVILIDCVLQHQWDILNNHKKFI